MFEYLKPEQVGIDSNNILAFIKELKKYRINIHGFSLSVKNAIVAEGYYAPFHHQSQHRMYSIAKSFVALAIGLLESEGKLSREDFIYTYFPEKLPKIISFSSCSVNEGS